MTRRINFGENGSIVLLLFLGVLLGALDISVVGPAIPAIENSIQLNGQDISRIFTAYLLFHLFGIPLMSKLSDIHGRKMVYIASIAIFSIGSLLVAASNNLTLLLVGRAIQGFGSSGIFPVAAATIGDVMPFEKRGKALGLLGGVYGIAFIIGPIIAGTVLHFFSWQFLFLINLPISLVLIYYSYKLLPGKLPGKKAVINWKSLFLLIVGLGSFSLGLNNFNVDQIGISLISKSVLPFLLLVVIFTPLLIMNERKQENAFFNPDIFKSKQLRLTILIAFGLGIFQSSIVFLPKMAVLFFNVLPSKASFMLLPLVLSTAIIPPISGRLLDSIGSRIIIYTGLIIALISLFLLSIVTKNIILFYAAEAGLGIGISIRASLKYILINEMNLKDRAISLGMLLIFINIGQITGAALIGSIISGSMGEAIGFGHAFLFLSMITAGLALLAFFLKKRNIELVRNKS
ncbi:MAG: MFS transporter [Bacteroidales bacterium]|nr:MFS transporter [Bacteroidales bacterium]